ncbi:hypothetical protein BDR04DRAFT_321248 [Suillus decipiens]|nr:hypothetical protein BDR04DRAFT_321248 [Suillus decipiens]
MLLITSRSYLSRIARPPPSRIVRIPTVVVLSALKRVQCAESTHWARYYQNGRSYYKWVRNISLNWPHRVFLTSVLILTTHQSRIMNRAVAIDHA